MHHFTYKNERLFCEDAAVERIAAVVGTPFYLYSRATLERHFTVFDSAFADLDRLVCFSAKANTSLALLKLFAGLGSGLDIVSGGELFRGLTAGIPPERVVYSGVGKRPDEIDLALEKGILMFNVESLQELEVIQQRAAALGRKAPVAIRVNPDVDPRTHPYISTGLKRNKFGISAETALDAYRRAQAMDHITVMGIDCHIGSQIAETAPFEDALENLLGLIVRLKTAGIAIDCLDVGGGLGITYSDEKPPAPDEYARAISRRLKGTGLKLILEPGRVIVGNAGILVTKVLYRKMSGDKTFVIADAGMNDLIRPALYNAHHVIQPVINKAGSPRIRADVVGPICESSDFLALDREMADVAGGDLLAVMSAGAYGYVMANNYCSRLKPAEVMVDGDRFTVIRQRQTYEDLIAGEMLD